MKRVNRQSGKAGRAARVLALGAVSAVLGACQEATPDLNAGAIPALPRAGEAPLLSGSSTTYRVDEQGNWVAGGQPAAGSDEAVLAKARLELAQDRPAAALATINAWLRPRERGASELIPQALLIRGDAKAASDEYEALYDYEAIIKTFPGAPEYVTAVERELEIGVRYLNGLKRKQWGMRIASGEGVGEELLLRVHERMPGSQLGERAVIELADYYYRELDLASAGVVYEQFAKNYPRSPWVMRAKQRAIFASLGQFKGPEYDTTILLDSGGLIRRFQNEYPAQAQAVGLDDALLTRIDESRAAQMLETAQWYLVRNDPVSARLTLRRLIKAHPRTGAAGTAYAELRARGWLEQAGTGNAEGAAGMGGAGGGAPETAGAEVPK